jgi:hypothetical protein
MVACGVADPDGLPGSVVAKAYIGGLVAVVDAFGFRLPVPFCTVVDALDSDYLSLFAQSLFAQYVPSCTIVSFDPTAFFDRTAFL